MVFAAALAGLFLIGCRSHDFPQYPANYREFAYVTNGGSDTVSVFDVVNIRLDRQIQVGQDPTGITANPKRNEVYVVNSGNGSSNGSVSVIDTEKNAVVATIPVHRKPYFLDVSPDGHLAYVANSGSNSVSVIDLDSRREIEVVGVGEAPGLVRVTPDDRSLIVTNRLGNSISILETTASAPPQLRKVIPGCPGATDVAILPDSSKAFVACSSGHQIMAIALAQAADSNHPSRPDQLEAMLDVGRSPVHLALKPDGGELFVSNFDSNSISEIVTSTDDVGGSYLMGSNPVRGLVTPDNALLFESDFSSQDISLYSIDDGKRIAPATGGFSIHVGDGPDALAFSSTGNLLFAVDARSGDVAVIRTSSQSLFTLLPTGRQPNAIALKSFRL
ncbi:YncE family protein [Acidicapsa dinghuensis]|uniref:YncE family protein n=1 Tax=Acidicapsa dinghuensis TaxID=2218256 RepID=A0ABW1EQL3_9BACT|nr:YncE family protein [Acidicapsa dinghuensis]